MLLAGGIGAPEVGPPGGAITTQPGATPGRTTWGSVNSVLLGSELLGDGGDFGEVSAFR